MKNNEHYGWYPDLPTALFDRDRLEQCDWNFSIFVELPEIPNPYKHMELPSFEHDTSYITIVPTRFRVTKRIDGKLRYFGEFKTLDEARERRDECISNGWKL